MKIRGRDERTYTKKKKKSSKKEKTILYNVTMRIISAIVNIKKREQDTTVPQNRIQVNARCCKLSYLCTGNFL